MHAAGDWRPEVCVAQSGEYPYMGGAGPAACRSLGAYRTGAMTPQMQQSEETVYFPLVTSAASDE